MHDRKGRHHRHLVNVDTARAVHDEWQGWALSTLPADRPAAEAAISALYGLAGHSPPRFAWADSPADALSLIEPAMRLRAAEAPSLHALWPVACRLATLAQDLRSALRRRLPSEEPLSDLIARIVRDPLMDGVRDALLRPIRRELDELAGRQIGFAWHGQHEAWWIGEFEAWRRIGGVTFPDDQGRQLEHWAALARSCGWWWPGDDLCVVTERPAAVHVDGSRLHRADGPAVEYRDGWPVYAWHGTRVPKWVITDPALDRIAGEGNVEIRRCAIERFGWAEYIDKAGLRMVAEAPDPGNPGSRLRLYNYDSVRRRGQERRVLIAVNGSTERDGTRRTYSLQVPDWLEDPIEAAGWTYGLAAAQYARLVRRT